MFDSVRLRLTLWYSLVLALVLVSLSVLTYFLYSHSISRRADIDLNQLTQAFLSTFRAELADQNKVDSAKNAAREAMLEHRFRSTCFFVLDEEGNVILSCLDFPNPGINRDFPSKTLLDSTPFHSLVPSPANNGEVQTIHGGRDGYRVLAVPLPVEGHSYTLAVAQSLHPQKEMLADIRNTFLLAIPIALLLASLGGYFLAQRSLAPVAAMAAQAHSIGAANLHNRLMVANERDELGQLALAFNQLLERLEASFEQQRRFMADASHELRTPVAILRGETEVTLSQPQRTDQDYRETLSILRQESQRLSIIVEDLFTLARADAGQYPLTLRETYLDEIASESLVRVRSLALSKKITLCSNIEPDLPILADETLMGRLLINLLDNAIKYSPSGSTVTLACRREEDRYMLCVSDNGAGIPAELQPRLFERFFRADKARSRSAQSGSEGETGGSGLGLAISRWIVEAHHGQLVLTHSDSSGSCFSATLPAKPQG
jgi:two-component system, OmpR family, sensor kinase